MKWVECIRSRREVRMWAAVLAVVGLLILGVYPMRELAAAELLLALGFLFVMIFGLAFYFLGELATKGAEITDAQAKAFTHVVQRGYNDLERTGRKWFHHVRARPTHTNSGGKDGFFDAQARSRSQEIENRSAR
jgi:choline-glycine betaine transporter